MFTNSKRLVSLGFILSTAILMTSVRAGQPTLELLFNGTINDSSTLPLTFDYVNTTNPGGVITDTVTAPTFVTDRFGIASSALQINPAGGGTNNLRCVITDPNFAKVSGAGPGSFSIWVNMPNNNGLNANNGRSWRVLSKRNTFADTDGGVEIEFNPGQNQERLAFNTAGAAAGQSALGAIAIDDGTWHHIVCIYDGTRSIMYVDGNMVRSEVRPNFVASPTHPLRFGVEADASAVQLASAAEEFMRGSIDDVRFFSSVLTPLEVHWLYRRNGIPAQLKTWTGANGSNFNDAGNWSPAAVPTAGDHLLFPSIVAVKSLSNDIVGLSVGGLTVDGGYTISGNALTLTDSAGPITVVGSATATFSLPITLAAGTLPVINAQNPANIVFNNTLTVTDAAATTLQIIADSNITFTAAGGILEGGVGVVSVNAQMGTGTLSLLNSSSTTQGNFSVAGILSLGANSVPATVGAAITSGPVGRGTLTINGTLRNTVPVTVANTVVLANTLITDGSQTLRINGTINMNGAGRTIEVRNTAAEGLIAGNNTRVITDTAGAIVRGNAANQTLTKTGAGTLVIEGVGNWRNQFFINAGTVIVRGAEGKLSDGNAGPDVRVADHATLILDNSTLPDETGYTGLPANSNGRINDGDTLQLFGNNSRVNIIGNSAANFTELISRVDLGNGTGWANGTLFIESFGAFFTELDCQDGTRGLVTAAFNGALVPGGRLSILRQNATGAGDARIRIRNGYPLNEFIPIAQITPLSTNASTATRFPTISINTPANFYLAPIVAGQPFELVKTGAWNDPTAWAVNGVTGVGFPGATDVAIIQGGFTATLDSARSVSAVIFRGDGEIAGANPLTVSGRVLTEGPILTGKFTCPLDLPTAATDIRVTNVSQEIQVLNGLTGTGTFVKNGNGYLVLSGVSSLTGTQTLVAGNLYFASNTCLGPTAVLQLNGGFLGARAAGIVLPNDVIHNGTIDIDSQFEFTIAGDGTPQWSLNNADRIVRVQQSSKLTIAATVVNGGGNRLLIKQGDGELVLSGANTHGGTGTTGTRIDLGVLTLANASAVGGAGSALIFNGPVNGASTIPTVRGNVPSFNMNYLSRWTGEFRVDSDGFLFNQGVTLTGISTVDVASGLTARVAGAVTGATFALAKQNAGTLKQEAALTTTGQFTVNGGVYQLKGDTASLTATGINLQNGGALEITNEGNGNNIADTVPVTFNSGTLIMTAPAAGHTEDVGTITLNSGGNAIVLNGAAGNATLRDTGAAVGFVRNGSATLNFARTGTASLIDTATVADTALVSYATVNGEPAAYEATPANLGLVPASTVGAVVKTTIANGGFGDNATWGTTPPIAGEYAVVRHAVTLTTAGAPSSHTVDGLTLDGGSIGGLPAQSLTVQSGLVGFVGATASAIDVRLNLGGATENLLLQDSSAEARITGPVSTTVANATLLKSGRGRLFVPGVVTLAGTGSVDVGAGTLALAGANSITGTFAVRDGATLELFDAPTLGTTTGVTIRGTLRAAGTFSTDRVFTIDAAALLDPIIDVVSGQTMTITGNNTILGNRLFVKTGAGRLEATGTTTRAVAGLSVNVIDGFLRFSNGLAFNINPGADTTLYRVAGPGAAEFNGVTTGDLQSFDLRHGARMIGVGQAGVAGDAIRLRAGATVYAEHIPTSVNQTFNFGTEGQDIDSDGIPLPTLIIRAPGGRVVMNDSTGFEGVVIAESGIFQCNGNNTLGDGNPREGSRVRVLPNAFLSLNAGDFSGLIILEGGTLAPAGGDRNVGNLATSGANYIQGGVHVVAPSTIQMREITSVDQARQLNLYGPLTGTADLTVTGLSVNKPLILSYPVNTYSGTIRVTKMGALRVDSPGALGLSKIEVDSGYLDFRAQDREFVHTNAIRLLNSTNDPANGPILNVERLNNNLVTGTSVRLTNLTIDANVSTVTVQGANGMTLAVDSALNLTAEKTFNVINANLRWNGVISGAGNLVKTGAAPMVLGGDNTHGGAILVRGGLLSLDGETGKTDSPLIRVESGGTFAIGAEGSANPSDRLLPNVQFQLAGGGLNLTAPLTSRSQVIDTLAIESGANTITIATQPTGAGDATLTVNTLQNLGNNPVALHRVFNGTAVSRLLLNPPPAPATPFPAFTVYEGTVVGTGRYDAADGIVAQNGFGGAVTYTSIASGNWNNPAIWATVPPTPGTFPTATSDVIVSTGHSVALTQNEACNSLRFAPNVFGATSALTGAFTLSVSSGTVQTDLASPAIGSGTGLRGEYTFNNGGTPNFPTPTVVRVDAQLNRNFTALTPFVPGLQNTNIGAIWTGYLQAPTTDTYAINFNTDDGVRVYLDGKLFIDRFYGQGSQNAGAPGSGHQSMAQLVAGRLYALRIEWTQGTGGGAFNLAWSAPSVPLQYIPASAMYPCSDPITVGCNLNFGAVRGSIINLGSAAVIINGTLNGTNGVEFLGEGITEVTAANSFTGGTTVRGGMVRLGNNSCLATGAIRMLGGTLGTTAVVFGATADRTIPNQIIADGDFCFGNDNNLNIGGGIVLTGRRVIAMANPRNVNLNAPISELGGSFPLIKSSFGTLQLNAPCNYSGETIIDRGTLLLNTFNALPVTTTVSISGAVYFGTGLDGTLNLNGFNQRLAGVVVGPNASPNQSVVTSGGGELILDTGASNVLFAGRVTGALRINKRGTGTLTFSGPSTFTGGLTIEQGTFKCGAGNNGSGAAGPIGNSLVTVLEGATFDADIYSIALPSGTSAVINGGTLTSASVGAIVTGGNLVASSGPLGTPATISGSLLLGTGAKNWTVEDGPGAVDLLINGIVSGTSPVTRDGFGTVEFTADNIWGGTYTSLTGTTRISGPSGSLKNLTALALTSSTLVIDDTAGSPGIPGRLSDAVPITFNSSSLTMLAQNNVSRAEAVGLLSFTGGSNTITLTGNGTGAAQLVMNTTTPFPTRTNSGTTFNLVRNLPSNLYFIAGVDDSDLPWATVNGLSSVYDGNSTSGQGLIAGSAGDVYVTRINAGDWNTAGTWLRIRDGSIAAVPGATDTAIVQHNVTVSQTPQQIGRVNFQSFNGSAGTPPFVVSGAGTLQVNTGVITVGGSIVGALDCNVDFATAEALITVGSATGTVNLTGNILNPNATGIVLAGPGTKVIDEPTNAFTAPVRVTAGVLTYTNDGSFGAVANAIDLAGGTLQINTSATSTRTFLCNGGSINVAAAQLFELQSPFGGTTGYVIKSGPGDFRMNTATAATRTGANYIEGGVFTWTNNKAALGTGPTTIRGSGTVFAIDGAGTNAATLPILYRINAEDGVILRTVGTTAVEFNNNDGTAGNRVVINVAFGAKIILDHQFTGSSDVGFLNGGGGASSITIVGTGTRMSLQQNGNYVGLVQIGRNDASTAVNFSVNHDVDTSFGFGNNPVSVVKGRFGVVGGNIRNVVTFQPGAQTGLIPIGADRTSGVTPFVFNGTTVVQASDENNTTGRNLFLRGLLSGNGQIIFSGVNVTNAVVFGNAFNNFSSPLAMTVNANVRVLAELPGSLGNTIYRVPISVNPLNGVAPQLELRGDVNGDFNANLTLGGSMALVTSRTTGTAPAVFHTLNDLTIASGATPDIINVSTVTTNVNGGVRFLGTVALNHPLSVNPSNNTLEFAGVVQGGSTLTKAGTNLLTLSGTASNTLSADIIVSAGTLQLNKTPGQDAIARKVIVGGAAATSVLLLAANQINDTNGEVETNLNGSLNLNNFNDTIARLTNTTAGTVALGSGTLTFGDAANISYSGTIGGTGNITKQGSGAYTFTTAHNYSGVTTVADGVLIPAIDGALGTIAGGTVVNGGTLALNNFSYTLLEPLTLNGIGSASTGALISQAGNNSFAGPITLGTNATIGMLSVGENLTLPGSVTLSTFTLTFDGVGNANVSSAIDGTGGVTMNGTGVLNYTGAVANTYVGTTNVNAGQLALNKTGVVAVPAALVANNSSSTDEVLLLQADQIANNATVTLTSLAALNLNNFNDTVGGLDLTGGLLRTGAGVLTLNGNVTATSSPASLSQVSGTLALGGADRTFTVTDGPNAVDLEIDAAITGTNGISKDGAGQLRYSGTSANTYNGTTAVNEGRLELSKTGVIAIAGALSIGDGSGGEEARLLAADQIANASNVSVNSGALFNLNNNNESIGALNLTSAIVQSGTGVLTLGGNITAGVTALPSQITGNVNLGGTTRTVSVTGALPGIELVVDAVLSGTGAGVTYSGTGDLQINSASTYDGATTVSGPLLILSATASLNNTSSVQVNAASELRVLGSVNAGATVTIAATGMLSGTGSVGTVASSGIVSPGTSIGTLTAGQMTFTATGAYTVELDGTGAGTSDTLNASGPIDLGNAALNATLTNGSAPDVFTVINNTGAGAVTGQFAGLPNGATLTISGQTFSIRYDGVDGLGNDVVLVHNNPPMLNAIGAQNSDELQLLTFTATATDNDLTDTLTFSLRPVTPAVIPAGMSITTSGVFTWTPTEAQGPGVFVVRVVVSDGTTVDFEDVTITINEVNVAVVLNPIGNFTNVPETTLLTFTATVTDPDLPVNTFTYALVGAPLGAAIGTNSGVFTWTPTENQGPGSYTFDVAVSDGFSSDSETITIDVIETNGAPVFTGPAITTYNIDELTQVAFTATAVDNDVPPNAFVFGLQGAPIGASIDGNTGAFTWTPTEAQGPGSYTFNITATDVGAPPAIGTLQITINVAEVNVAPVLGAIGNQTIAELTQLTFTATATDVDLPANTLTYSLVGAPASAFIVGNTGVFTWTPTEAQGPGTFTFDVVVSDGTVTDSETITVTVNEVNVAPVASNANVNTNEDTPVNGTVIATDTDVPVQTLTYSVVTNGTLGSAVINANTGAFTYTPNLNASGIDTVQFVANDGVTNSAPATITINIAPINDGPVIADQTFFVGQGKTVSLTLSATDVDSPNLLFSLNTAPSVGSVGPFVQVTGTSASTTYTAPATSGSTTFIVQVGDGILQSTATITMVITPPPTIQSVTIQPSPALAGLPITGTATGAAQNGAPTYDWNWGDGTSATGPNVSKTYPIPGQYTITLTVTSPDGVATVQTFPIFVSFSAGGGAEPPPIDPTTGGLLIGKASKFGTGAVSMKFTQRTKTSFSAKLKNLTFPEAMTQASLTGKTGTIIIGSSTTVNKPTFVFDLNKSGKGKATGVGTIQVNVKKKTVNYKLSGRTDLTDVLESFGATQSVLKPGKDISVPMTIQIGDNFFLAVTFQLRYTASQTAGKGATLKK